MIQTMEGLNMKKFIYTILFIALFITPGNSFAAKDDNDEAKCRKTSDVAADAYEAYLSSKKDNASFIKIIKESYDVNAEEVAVLWLYGEKTEMAIGKAGREAAWQANYDACMRSKSSEKEDELDKEPGRFAHEGEIEGAYELIQAPEFINKDVNLVDDPLGEKYQYLIFDRSGVFKIMSINKHIKYDSRKEVEEFLDAMDRFPGKKQKMRWKFLKDGFISIYRGSDPLKNAQLWSVNIITEDFSPSLGYTWKKGDILLGFDKDGERVYLKQLRKIKDK